MSKLFDDAGFWAKETVLEAECEGDEYDGPAEEEDYPLHASKDDPRVKNAKHATQKRRSRIKRRQMRRNKKQKLSEEALYSEAIPHVYRSLRANVFWDTWKTAF